MSDSFLNPQDQAALSALNSRLGSLDSEIRALQKQLDAELAARRQGAPGERRVSDTSGPTVRAEAEAIQAQVVSYKELNNLIRQRIELEGQAFAAVMRTTQATSGSLAEGAAAAKVGATSAKGVLLPLGASVPAAAETRAKTTAATTAAKERAVPATRALAVSEAALSEQVVKANAMMIEFDQTLARTGGLSGEALSGLAAGTITIKDLGNQVEQTIGKFGGWTLAAGAVYGVLGALSDVKAGAVDTSSAIQGLTKFIPNLDKGQARQQLVQQSEVTNTPIKEVGQTAQQFSKIFKGQGDVFTATHVALTAAKLDNITLADSYKYLTAITQEAGLKASQLPGIFDQITAAQDHLGARISVTLPALAGSMSAVTTGGGNINQLLALESLAAVRTGRSGSQIATAFGRGATNFFSTAKGQGTLEQYGINPHQGVTQALIDAIGKANDYKGKPMTGNQKVELAGAFFGPLAGTRMAPLFNSSPTQLQEYLKGTAPGESKGLADQQLAKTTSQANEQITKLKTNLGAIGAELSSTGVDTPFKVLITLLNKALELTGELLKAWGSMPGAIKQAAGIAATVAGPIALARRFNVGAGLAVSDHAATRFLAPVFAKSPEKVATTRAEQILAASTAGYNAEIESAGKQIAASSQEVTKANAAYVRVMATETAGVAEQDAARAEMLAAQQRYDAALLNAADWITAKETYAGKGSALAAGAAGGAAGKGASAVGSEAALVGGGAAVVAADEAQVVAGSAVTASLAKMAAAQAAAAAANAAEGTSAGFAAGAEMALTGAALRLSMAFDMLVKNAIPLAIAGFLSFKTIQDTVRANTVSESQGINKMASATTGAGLAAGYDQATSRSVNLPFGISINDQGAANAAQNLGLNDGVDQLYRAQQGQLHADATGQGVAAAHLHPVAQLMAKAHGQSGSAQANTYKQALQKAMEDKALQFLDPGMYSNIISTIEGKLAAATSGSGSIGADFQGWIANFSGNKLANLESQIVGFANQAKVLGSSGATGNSAMNEVLTGYAFAVKKYGQTNDPAAWQALATAQNDVKSALSKQIQDLSGLATASTSFSGQAGDYKKGVADVTAAMDQTRKDFAAMEVGASAAQKKTLEAAKNAILGRESEERAAPLSALLGVMQTKAQLATSTITGVGPQADLKRAEATLAGLATQIGAAKAAGADWSTLAQLQSSYNQQVVQVMQSKLAEDQQMEQALSQFQQAGTLDPVAQANIDIQNLNTLSAKLKAQGINNPLVNLQIATQKRQDANALLADQLSQISAQSSLAQAQTFDPVAIAQAALDGDRRALQFMILHHEGLAKIVAQEAQVANDAKAKLSAVWTQQEGTIEFNAATYQITGAQEIQQLQKLYENMKKQHASLATLQGVYQKIWDLEYGNTANLNLNTGAMHMPSTYEVKSAILNGRQATKRKTTAGLLADVKTNVTMTVTITKDADLHKFTQALNQALGTSVNGLAQAAGMI